MKFKRIVSLILAFVMTASLFTNWPMPAFAADGVERVELNPAVSTTITAENAELFADVTDGAEKTNYAESLSKPVTLKTKVTTADGVVYYEYAFSGLSTTDMRELASQFKYIKASDVAYVEEKPPMLGAINGDETAPSGSQTTKILVNGVEIETISITGEELPIDKNSYFIWENSVFYSLADADIKATDDIQATFPVEVIGKLFENSTVKDYTYYTIFADGTIRTMDHPYYTYSGVAIDTTNEAHGGEYPFKAYNNDGSLAVAIGFARDLESANAYWEDYYDFRFTGNSATFYADFARTQKVTVDVEPGDYFTATDEITTTYNGEEVRYYMLGFYDGTNDRLIDVADKYFYIYISADEVEPYVEPDPTPDVTPEPTPDTPEEIVLKDENTGILVSGKLPEGTTLSVNILTADQINLDTVLYPLGQNTKVYDIKLMLNGAEYTPEEPVTIEFTKDNIGFAEGTGYMIYNIYGNEAEDVSVIGPIMTGDGLTLTVENPSQLVFANLYKETGTTTLKGAFKKPTVTVYGSMMPEASSMMLSNAEGYAVTTTAYYEEYDGTIWYRIKTAIRDSEGNSYRWVKAENLDITVTDEATGISVTGDLQKNIVAMVEETSADNLNLEQNKYEFGPNTVAYDVSLLKNGRNYQPESTVQVNFPKELFAGKGIGKRYIGYHIHDDGTVDVLGAYEYTGEDISVAVDSFSVIAFNMFEEEIPLKFKGTTATLYQAGTNISNIVAVTDQDIVYAYGQFIYEVKDKDGNVIEEIPRYYIDYYVTSGEENFNQALYEAVRQPPFEKVMTNTVNVADVVVYNPSEEDTLTDQTITDPQTDIGVTGNLPQNTSVAVKNESIPSGWDNAKLPLGKNTKVYDISLSHKNAEYQPTGPVTISIPHSALGFAAGKGLVIYHIHGTGADQETSIIGPIRYNGEGLELTVEGFSQFIFTDLFEEASSNGWAGVLNKEEIIFYSDIITKFASINQGNMLNTVVRGNAHYVDADGTVWLRIQNGAVYENDTSYRWIKQEDVYLTKFDGQRITPAVNYTQVAPLVKAEAAPAAPANYTTFNARALTRGIAPQAEVSDGLYINKSIVTSDPVTGTATIKIEAYVTGEVETKTTVLPTDVVVILDLSYSMTTDMAEIEYVTVSGQAETIYRTYGDTLYVKVGNKRYPVTIIPGGTTSSQRIKVPSTLTNSQLEKLQDTKTLYYLSNGQYRKLEINRNYYGWGDPSYTYSYGSGWGQSSSGDNTVPNFINNIYVDETLGTEYTFSYTPEGATQPVSETFAATANITAEKYLRPQIVGEISRFEALQNAVKQFADDIHTLSLGETDSADDNIANTLAIVTYSGEGNANDGDLNPTGLYYNNSGTIAYESLVTSSDTRFETIENYGNALLDMTNATIAGQIDGIIDSWDTGNGTRTDLGTEMALGIISAQPNSRYVDAAGNVIRNKVVVLFTDGEPESGVENDIVADAWQLKNTYNTTVYTIAVTEGADAEITVSADGSTGTINTSGINDLMHYVSNNFKNATSMGSPGNPTFIKEKDSASGEYVISGDSYYLTAEDSESLNEIFSKISTAIDASAKVQLDSTAQLKDIISPYFTLTEGGKIENVILEEYDAVYTDGVLGWESKETATRIPSTEDNVELIDKDGDGVKETINVVGFDYAANFVSPVARKRTESSTTADFYGSKLVITLPVIASEYFFGGNCAITNGSESGIYRPKKDENGNIVKDENGKPIYEPVKPFDVPDSNVNIIDIDIEWDDQHIYRTNSANLDTLFRKARVKNRYSDERKTLEEVLDGVNNDYVNMKFTVTEKGTNKVIGTFTVNAGQTVNQGTWDTTDNLYPVLENDTDYLLTWVIEPSIELPEGQTVPTINHDDPVEATVYVYNPVLTFKDDNAFYGDNVPTLSDNLVNNVVWVNASQGYAEYGNGTIYKDVVEDGETNKTDTGNDMLAPEPQLVIDCTPVSGVTDGIITTTSDIPVNVTVTKDVQGGDDVDITTLVEFKHQDCSGETYKLGVEGETTASNKWPSGAEFVIHIDTAELSVSKTIDANGITGFDTYKDTFTFTVNITANVNLTQLAYTVSGDPYTATVSNGKATFTLKNGQTAVFTNLPVGTYVVTEDENPSYTTTVSPANGTVELVDDTAKAVTFTNKIKTTSLTVSKTVEDFPAALTDFVNSQTFTFTIKVDGVANGTALAAGITNGGKFTLKHGESVIFENLPVGATYTVTEEDHNMFDAVSPETDGVKGKAAGTLAATANSAAFKNKISVGTLTISKEVVVGANTLIPDDTFTFEVTHPGTVVVNYIVYNTNGTTATEDDTVVRNGVLPANAGEITLKDSQYAVIANIPVGEYSVAEKADAVSSKYTVTSVNASGTLTPTGVTAAFTNTLKTVGLNIKKDVESPAGITHPDFEFTVSIPGVNDINALTYTVNNVTKQVTGGKITLKDGETAVFTGLPAGSSYEVVEVVNGNYTANPEKHTGTLPNSGVKEVTFTNVVKRADLTIKKYVNKAPGFDLPATVADEFTFTVAINAAGSYKYTVNGEEKGEISDNGTITLKGGETAVIKDLPIGTVYTVTETEHADYTLTSKTGDSGKLALDGATAEFTNTYKTGSLAIKKVVEGIAPGINVENESFNFLIELDTNFTGTATYTVNGGASQNINFTRGVARLSLKDGETAVIAGVPVGSYKVMETILASNDFSYERPDLYEGVITETGTPVVEFVNTIIKSALDVSKTVVSPAGIEHPEFTFRLSISNMNVAELEYTINEGSEKFKVNADGTFTLKDGQTAHFTNLAANGDYTVEEIVNDNYDVNSAEQSGTLPYYSTKTVTFTNTLKTGNIQIGKVVTKAYVNDTLPGDEFTFIVDLPGNDTTKTYAYTTSKGGQGTIVDGDTVTLVAGETVTINGVPLGEFRVVETADANYVTTVTKGTAGEDNYTVTGTVTAGQTAEVEFTNEYTKHVGDLKISKEVVGVTGFTKLDDTFTFTVSVVDQVNGTYNYTIYQTANNAVVLTGTITEPGTITLKDDQYAVIKDLPLNTVTVAEEANPKYSTTVNGKDGRMDSVTITTDDKAEIAFINTQLTGELDVTKTVVTGTGVDVDTAKEFTFTVNVNGGGTTQLNYAVDDETRTVANGGTFTLKHGQTAKFTGLPAGATYKVSEITDAAYTLTAKSGDEGTISATTTAKAEFTNTLNYGVLEISKTVVVPNGINVPADVFTFKVEFTGTGTLTYNVIAGEETVSTGLTVADGGFITLIHGQKAVFNQVPLGAVKVTEDDESPKYTSTPVNGVFEGTVTATAPVVATFTNTMNTGRLSVQKIVSMPAGIAVNWTEGFDFTVKINNVAKDDVIHYSVVTSTTTTPRTAVVDENGNITIILRHYEKAVFNNLPVGAYEVTENLTDAQKELYTTTATNPEGTIEKGALAEVVFTNTLKSGTLTVSKEVVVPYGITAPDDTFTFKVEIGGATAGQYLTYKKGNTTVNEVVDENGAVTFTLKNGESVVFQNMPAGAQYTVTEVADAVSGKYNVSYTGATGTFKDNAAEKAEFTNTLKTLDLTITKDVTGDLYNEDDTFVFTVVDNNNYGISLEVVIAGEGSAVIKNLPLGEYTVTENTAWSFRYDLTHIDDQSASGATSKVVAVDDTVNTVKFTNKAKDNNKWLDAAALAENKFASAGQNN